MLARQLPGVAVLTCAQPLSRRPARRAPFRPHRPRARRRVSAPSSCDRDVDIVDRRAATTSQRPETLPCGRLREPLDTLARPMPIADGSTTDVVRRIRRPGSCRPAGVRVERRADRRHRRAPRGRPAGRSRSPASPQPARFFADLRAAGWTRRARAAVPRSSPLLRRRDLTRDRRERRGAAGARLVVTTEKDCVRLLPFRPLPLPVACRAA